MMTMNAGLPFMPLSSCPPHPVAFPGHHCLSGISPVPPAGFAPTPRLSNPPLCGPGGPGVVRVKWIHSDHIFHNAIGNLQDVVRVVRAKCNIMHMRAHTRARVKFIFCIIFFFLLKNTRTTRTN